MKLIASKKIKWLSKNLYEIYLEVSHFLRKGYPDFVTSSRPGKIQGVPVFTFHTIRPRIFEEQLEFLKENDYRAIGVDDFYNYLIGKRTLSEKAILLTIDDGRKSVWLYGFPLLKKFGFRATIFVIPGHTKDKDPSPSPQSSPPGGEDIIKSSLSPIGRVKGEGGFEDIGDESDEDILSWQEILIMMDSGLIDFGSHTLYHHKIFTGPEIIEFFGPGYNRKPYSYPAVPAGLERAVLEREPSEFYGMPIYVNDSLMAGKPRFIDAPEFREECIRFYKTIDPELKTKDYRWEKEMFRFSIEYRKRNGTSESFSTLEDTAKEIYDNLYTSKKVLEEKLGRSVSYLCYPFGIWSPLSIEMAKKAGYSISFCSYIPGRRINKSGDDPHKIVRLKDDYIFRLPGKGRKSLSEIFLMKMKRRLKREMVY